MMTRDEAEAADDLCPTCDGKGVVTTAPVEPDLSGQTLKLHPFGPQAGAPKDGARVLSLGEVAARVAELTRRVSALENPNEYDNSKLMPAPAFRTSRKPDAPGVMTDDEAIELAWKTGRTTREIANMLFAHARQSVLAQLAANEERAVEAGLELWRETIPLQIRAALAAIREGL